MPKKSSATPTKKSTKELTPAQAYYKHKRSLFRKCLFRSCSNPKNSQTSWPEYWRLFSFWTWYRRPIVWLCHQAGFLNYYGTCRRENHKWNFRWLSKQGETTPTHDPVWLHQQIDRSGDSKGGCQVHFKFIRYQNQ